MEIEIITKHDLEDFRQRLMRDLATFMRSQGNEHEKEYLRTKEARKMLGSISNGTLQNIRVKGLLKPSKIEGVYYYKLCEIKALLNEGTKL